MSVFKCKMCGGSLSVSDGATVTECEYCGTIQTLPKSTDEVIVNLFNRANNLRLKGDFDKAAGVYEKILDFDNTQAEAHWGIVLCKYGVEYVEDPLTKERIPTCHRTQVESILTDTDYQAVLQYADSVSRAVYEKQAAAINELQKKILEIVKSEKPFDVFICYKETDESGARTKDSVIANEIYHELTNSGLKVFFAAITLENKLGREYEPYIFAALTSAKVMLVLGTKQEYFNAVWVKNEWSRYLHLMRTDRQAKRTLIPCFRDMDAYDLPDEFSHLQALDMANIAFLPDLSRNLSKLLSQKPKIISDGNPESEITPLLKRAFIFIEDGEYDHADKLLEEVLNQQPENAKAYVGKFLTSHNLRTEADLASVSVSLLNDNNLKRACRYADDDYRQILSGYIQDAAYKHALQLKNQGQYAEAEKGFRAISTYKNAEQQAEECLELALKAVYDSAMEEKDSEMYKAAAELFATIHEYKDAKEQREECLRLEDEKTRLETEKQYALKLKEEQEQKRLKEEGAKKKKKNTIIGISVLLVIVAFICAAVFIVSYTDDHRLGGKENPIYLSTPEDLMSIDSFTSSIYSGGNYNYYVLKNDIDMTGYSWVPLGDSMNLFYGSLSGDGHTISNLHIDASVLPDSKDSELGFIHTIHKDSRVSNLNFENVRISGTTGTEKIGVVAYISQGNIINCNVTGISSTSAYGIGGVVYALSYPFEDKTSNVLNSHVSGTINGHFQKIGGVVGQLLCSRSNVELCSFTGNINPHHSSPESTSDLSYGGICSTSKDGIISGCTVSGSVRGYEYVGGICGYSTGDLAYINNCTFNGVLSAASNNPLYNSVEMGGIAGYGDGLIYRCTSSGSVISANIGYTGALVGEMHGDMMECSSSSSVYTRTNPYAHGLIGKIISSYGSVKNSEYFNERNTFTGEVVRITSE